MALPQQHRLRGRQIFDRIYRQGRRFHGEWMVLRVMTADPSLEEKLRPAPIPGQWRCAVVVSGKVTRKAVRRNRLRRQLHGLLLRRPPTPASPQWLLISLRPGSADAGTERLLGECRHLLHQAGLLQETVA